MLNIGSTKWILSATLIAGLTGCGGGSNSNGDTENRASLIGPTAVIQVVSPEYNGGAGVQLAALGSETITAADEIATTVETDFTVATYGDTFFHIGQFGLDTVTKVDLANETTFGPELSTLNDPEDFSSNPYTLVFVNENKAYLISYGIDSIWIVNPNATEQSEFKLGELDISAYDIDDGTPEAADGIIIDGKLYVVMQRLNRNDGWTPVEEGRHSYVAVFDTTTDTEIDTDTTDDEANLKGIPLDTRNPKGFVYHQDVGLFVVAAGDPWGSEDRSPNRYVGGISQISTEDYSISMLVDDGTAAENDHPYGHTMSATILDENNGFFIGLTQYQQASLFHFDPSTGDVTAIPEFVDLDLSTLVTGPNGLAWLGIHDPEDPRIVLLNADGSVDQTIELFRNPKAIAFAGLE